MFAMIVDIDRCTGCGACAIACAAENNVAPAAERATERTGVTQVRVVALANGSRGAFLPMMCMQCGHETPCVTVCPQQAVELDKATGIVTQMPQRCLGCRYCMTACPYHARSYNWFDPEWPAGMEATLNPRVAPRMRGVVEKCNFCHGRYHASQDAGEKSYQPACAEACPTQAIAFGESLDTSGTFAWLEQLGTQPKVRYRSGQSWVRELAERGGAAPDKESRNG
jgi:menaquinone reductase, iron-sulfur cluster-binding subunit